MRVVAHQTAARRDRSVLPAPAGDIVTLAAELVFRKQQRIRRRVMTRRAQSCGIGTVRTGPVFLFLSRLFSLCLGRLRGFQGTRFGHAVKKETENVVTGLRLTGREQDHARNTDQYIKQRTFHLVCPVTRSNSASARLISLSWAEPPRVFHPAASAHPPSPAFPWTLSVPSAVARPICTPGPSSCRTRTR